MLTQTGRPFFWLECSFWHVKYQNKKVKCIPCSACSCLGNPPNLGEVDETKEIWLLLEFHGVPPVSEGVKCHITSTRCGLGHLLDFQVLKWQCASSHPCAGFSAPPKSALFPETFSCPFACADTDAITCPCGNEACSCRCAALSLPRLPTRSSLL